MVVIRDRMAPDEISRVIRLEEDIELNGVAIPRQIVACVSMDMATRGSERIPHCNIKGPGGIQLNLAPDDVDTRVQFLIYVLGPCMAPGLPPAMNVLSTGWIDCFASSQAILDTSTATTRK